MELLNNKPISRLDDSTDYLGILEKANFLKDFFISIKDNNELKMFCLYGDWGSGKSTVLKYLKKELETDYNTFFFEAWEYDQNNNIPYSLFEFLTKNSQDTLEKDLGIVLKTAKSFLKGFGKSLKFEYEIPFMMKLGIEPKELIDELAKENNKTEFELKQDFKEEFRRVESCLIAKGKKSKNIIFIDDLDRCDPEHTLALLSAIKLFFTYGEQTIFICGIDKNAVQEAIKTKYHDYIKSSEYLEKIFDVSFNMPENHDIQKLINVYFDEIPIIYNNKEDRLNEIICTFFNYLNFLNPRKIKKILNKFSILSNYTKSQQIGMLYSKGNTDFCAVETIMTLYGLLTSEFYPEAFNNFLNIEKRKIVFENLPDSNPSIELIKFTQITNISLSKIQLKIHKTNYIDGFLKLKFIFCPLNISKFNAAIFNQIDEKDNIPIKNENELEYRFYKFIFLYLRPKFLISGKSNISLDSIKKNISNMS